MKYLACLTFSLAASSLAFGQETQEEPKPKPERHPTYEAGIEILKKVDEAAKAVNAVRYDGMISGTLRNGMPMEMKGKVVYEGAETPAQDKYFFDATIKIGSEGEAKRFTVGGNGDTYFLIDWEKKIAYEDLDPAVVGSVGGQIRGLYMREFTHPTPFSDEINARNVEVREEDKVGDEACYVIHVQYAVTGAQESTWYFSKKDYLPRRRILTFGLAPNPTVATVTNLKVEKDIDDKEFDLKLPEGFEKTDEFAPNNLVPRQ